MKPSPLLSSFSISSDGTSPPGATDLMKGTPFKEFTKEMVKNHENVQEEQKDSEVPAKDAVVLGGRSATAPLVPVSLKFLNISEKKNQDSLNGSRQVFIPRQETLVVKVHVEQPRRRLQPQVPRPGFLSRLGTGCLNGIKRCFGRSAG